MSSMSASQTLVAAVTLAAGMATGLAAQEPRDFVARRGGDMMPMMAMMEECPMMRATRQGPAAVLDHRDSLALNEVQVRRLEALAAESRVAQGAATERMRGLHREIANLTERERFDEAAVRTAWERMGTLHADWGVTLSRIARATRDVLTPEQRERLAGLSGGMNEDRVMMMRMMDHMRTMQCPMMRDDSAGAHHMRRP